MKSKILLGFLLSVFMFIMSYSIVRVPIQDIPDDYYTNSAKYSNTVLNEVNEYHISFNFVKIEKCDVICPNKRGFPFTIKNVSVHEEWNLAGLIANFIVSIFLGMFVSIASFRVIRNQKNRLTS